MSGFVIISEMLECWFETDTAPLLLIGNFFIYIFYSFGEVIDPQCEEKNLIIASMQSDLSSQAFFKLIDKWSHLLTKFRLNKLLPDYHIYPKYLDTTTPYHTCSKIWTRTNYYPLCLKLLDESQTV